MKKMNKKGFTIVELVIVIAVIAILAAVLIPTFGSVIGKSKESAAQSKAKNALEIVVALEDPNDANYGKTKYAFKADDYYFTYEPAADTAAGLSAGTKTAPTGASDTNKVYADNEDIKKLGVTVYKTGTVS